MPHEEVSNTYRELLPAHKEAIRIAARSGRHPSTPKDHSPGLIVFIGGIIGRKLPQPEYVKSQAAIIPEEISIAEVFVEGALERIFVNRYERDRKAVEKCKGHYGRSCTVCKMTFEEIYGPEVAELIHVHHLKLISSIGKEYTVDPILDLRLVCPNCHAVIHSVNPPRKIEDVRAMMRRREVPRSEN